MKRGQGTFEYVLLLGGVLLIVVLAIVVLQQTAQSGFQGAGQQQCTARLLTDLSCQSSQQADRWNECGLISEASYVGCGAYAATNDAGAACPGSPLAQGGGSKFCGTKPLSS